MKKILTLLMLFFCLPLAAQVEVNTVKRTCRVLFLKKTAEAPDTVYLFDGKTSHKIYLSGKAFSLPVELPNGPLTIFISPTAVNLPEELPPGVPNVTVPKDVNDLYLIAGSDPENETLPIQFKPINVNNERLKLGETLWINLSKHNVIAKLGEHQVSIPPMKQAISPAPLDDNGYYPAQFIYQHNSEGKYRKVLNKTWRFQVNSKSLGFIIDAGGRRPEIFTIRDRRIAKTSSTTN